MSKDTNGATSVMLITGHLSNGGGVAVYTELLIDRLSGRFKIDHLKVGARNSVSGKALEPGALRAVRRLVVDFLQTVRAHRLHRHGIVHVNPSMQPKSILRDGAFLIYLRLVRFRSVVVFYHGWSPAFVERIRSNSLWRTAFRWVFGWVPCTIVLSEAFRPPLIEIGFDPKRTFVSSTMFDGKALENATEDTAETDTIKEGERGLQILFMSRVERNKGIYELVDAVAELANDYPNLKLTVAGDGTALPDVRRHVESMGMTDQIKLLGYVASPHEKAKLMNASQVFCLPTSHGEGMPVSLLEAMGAGLAVISTPVGGIAEACGKGGAILLPDPTKATLATALRKLQDDREYCCSLQAHNRRRAWKLYEADVVVRNIESMYLAVAGQPPQDIHLTPQTRSYRPNKPTCVKFRSLS